MPTTHFIEHLQVASAQLHNVVSQYLQKGAKGSKSVIEPQNYRRRIAK